MCPKCKTSKNKLIGCDGRRKSPEGDVLFSPFYYRRRCLGCKTDYWTEVNPVSMTEEGRDPGACDHLFLSVTGSRMEDVDAGLRKVYLACKQCHSKFSAFEELSVDHERVAL